MSAAVRLRRAGWAVILACCFAALLALTFKVNAVKSEVRLTERHIITAQRERLMLETEFQTRASQHQLAAWNAVEFGYGAPRADQYLESETQLAALGSPRGHGAPSPVRVALNRPAREDDSILSGWIATEAQASEAEPAEAPARRARRGGIAERLAAAPLAQVADAAQ